jgi:exonuclease SbcC
VVGSHDGKKLRVFAQSLTLEALLERANAHLSDLAPRYRLERVEGQDLELQVRDRDLGGEVRATTGLSGGESFLVSLALALALSGLCAAGTRVESLFIDEGFGSLDPDAQEQALAALDALQASGRQVVLVSHLPAIAERVGLSVRVVPQGQGRSLVEVGAVTPEPEPDTNLPVGSAQ